VARVPKEKGVLEMLVLSRKVGERIVLPGCDLTITVVRVRGKQVRLGVSAPDDVAIHREEVWLRRSWTTSSTLPDDRLDIEKVHRLR
jgi:carbon storage regulator